jgi:hypothetical protein
MWRLHECSIYAELGYTKYGKVSANRQEYCERQNDVAQYQRDGGFSICKILWGVEYDSSFLVKVLVPLCMFLLYKKASAYFMVSILVSQHAESHKTNFMTSFHPSPLATSLSLVIAIYRRCAGRADKGKETFLDLPARCRRTTSYVNSIGHITFTDYCLGKCK